MDRFVQKLKLKGLITPALIFLELHRPLRGLAYHMALFVQPCAQLFVSTSSLQAIMDTLSRSESIDYLQSQLELSQQEEQAY